MLDRWPFSSWNTESEMSPQKSATRGKRPSLVPSYFHWCQCGLGCKFRNSRNVDPVLVPGLGTEPVPGAVAELVRRGEPQAPAGGHGTEQATGGRGQDQSTGDLHPVQGDATNHRAVPTPKRR